MIQNLRKYLRPVLTLAIPSASIFGIAYMAYSYSSGISLQTNKPGSGQGCTCHSPNANSATSVTIVGPDKFEAGGTYDLIVTVSNPNKAAGGVDIAVSKGTLAPKDSKLLQRGTELTHKSPSGFINGKTSWAFKYTAPTGVASDTIYAASNAVNLNGGDSGDQWNFAPKFVVNIETSGVEETAIAQSSLTLLSNPAQGAALLIVSQEKITQGRIALFDSRGALLRELPTQIFAQGNTEVRLDLNGLAAGEYFARMYCENGAVRSAKIIKLN